uniref:C2H2-type domain-containing protein n=1 Tax=viral metagenome TaxID=1070528 RepID=A0A6C0EAP4_9ZZZZ
MSNTKICCNTPFIQEDTLARTYYCLSCNKKYSIEHAYECPKCHKNPANISWIDVDDESDTYSDYIVECGSCGQEYEENMLIHHEHVKFHATN